MDLKDIKDLSDNLDQKQSNAILGLIDQKINNDMEKALNKIDDIKNSLEVKIDGQNHKIDAQGHKIGTLEKLLWGLIVTLALFIITMWLKR